MSAEKVSSQNEPMPPDDIEQGQERPKSTIVTKLVTILSVTLILVSVAYFMNVPKHLGFIMPIVQYCGVCLAILMPLTFLVFPAKKNTGRDKIPWYDVMFIIFGMCGGGYIALFMETWSVHEYMGMATTTEIVLCFLLIVSILEALRRTLGPSLFALSTFFYLYLVVGNYLPEPFALATKFPLDRITNLLYFRTEGLFGTPLQVAFTIIIMFMLFGVFLSRSNAGSFIINFALALTGHWTGGPAKAAIVASSTLGTMSGLSTANVATTGAITIPLMKKTGYKPEFAGAVEAVASNGGIITPPVMGAVAFLMAEWLEMPYWSLCIAAFLPAVLYYFCLFMQVHLNAAKNGLRGLPRKELPSLFETLRGGWFYFLPVLVLVYFLAVENAPPQHAGLYSTVVVIIVILIDWQSRKATRKSVKEIFNWLIDCIVAAGKQLITPGMACASAGIIIGCVTASGIGFKLAMGLLTLSGGHLITLLLLCALCAFIFGMGVPGMASYVILAVLVAPALTKLGVVPLAAHLFILYWAITSFITPPVAVSCFVAAGIADASPFRTGLNAVRLGILTFVVPFIFVYNPSLLLIGPIMEIAVVLGTCIIGVVFLSFGLEGYLLKSLTWPERILFLGGGGLLLVPGVMTDIVGAAVLIPALIYSVISSRRAKAAISTP